MAKEKKKKEKVKKEKPPRSGPGKFSRISLPVVLIPLFILAGASFFALGLLKQKAATEAKLATIDNRVAQKIDDLPPPTFQKPPPTLPSSMSATDIQPTMAGQPEPPAPSAPAPASAAAVQPAPAIQAPLPQAAAEPAAPPAATGTTLPGTAPVQGPAQGPITPPVAATAAVTTPVAPPVQAPEPEKGGPLKPMWQTVDQKWDDVVVQPAEQGPAGDTSAAWRSINIGQSDEVSNQVAQSPIMGAALAPPEMSQSEKAPEMDAPPKVAPSKKVKSSVRPTRKTVNRKRPVRVPTVAIINESGVPQAAQLYRDVLLVFSSSVGVKVGPIQEAPPRPGTTTIFYGAGMKAKAQALARRIPGQRTLAPLRADTEHDILLVVRSR